MTLKAFEPRASENFSHTTLRGIAALCVVAFHALQDDQSLPSAYVGFLQSSYLFVDLFFMLSGFIMVETYAARIRTGPWLMESLAFLRRRVAKILPNYYFWLAISIVYFMVKVAYFTDKSHPSACLGSAVLRHTLLLQHLVGSCVKFNIPLWSIATEAVIYGVFPALVFLLRYWVLLIIMPLLIYPALLMISGDIDIISGMPSLARTLAGFMIGMLLGQLSCRVPCGMILLSQISLAGLLVVFLSFGMDMSVIVIMAGLVLVTARDIGPMAGFSRLMLPYSIGRASFSIYLAHILVVDVVFIVATKLDVETGFLFWSKSALLVPISVVLSALVGLLSYILFEHVMENHFRRNRVRARAT